MSEEDLASKLVGTGDFEHIRGKICVKCTEPALYAGIDVKKAVYCRPCFIHMVKSKFRSTITKRRIFKDGENRDILVVYDGSSSSAFLLHQIEDAVKQTSFKRLMVNPTMLILVSVCDKESIHLVETKVSQLRLILPNIKWIILHIAAAFDSTIIAEDTGRCIGVEQIDRLNETLSSCNTSTAREEVLRIVREKACSVAVKSTCISKVMLPDDGDRLGRDTLIHLCLGRGGQVSDLVGAFDKRSNGTSFVRPLRELSSKEIAIVNRLQNYEDSALRINSTLFDTNSIHSLTSDFVDTLVDEGFKSTVSTVLSTAGKVHSTQSSSPCSLCGMNACSSTEDDNQSSICRSCQLIADEMTNPQLLFRLSQI